MPQEPVATGGRDLSVTVTSPRFPGTVTSRRTGSLTDGDRGPARCGSPRSTPSDLVTVDEFRRDGSRSPVRYVSVSRAAADRRWWCAFHAQGRCGLVELAYGATGCRSEWRPVAQCGAGAFSCFERWQASDVAVGGLLGRVGHHSGGVVVAGAVMSCRESSRNACGRSGSGSPDASVIPSSMDLGSRDIAANWSGYASGDSGPGQAGWKSGFAGEHLTGAGRRRSPTRPRCRPAPRCNGCGPCSSV